MLCGTKEKGAMAYWNDEVACDTDCPDKSCILQSLVTGSESCSQTMDGTRSLEALDKNTLETLSQKSLITKEEINEIVDIKTFFTVIKKHIVSGRNYVLATERLSSILVELKGTPALNQVGKQLFEGIEASRVSAWKVRGEASNESGDPARPTSKETGFVGGRNDLSSTCANKSSQAAKLSTPRCSDETTMTYLNDPYEKDPAEEVGSFVSGQGHEAKHIVQKHSENESLSNKEETPRDDPAQFLASFIQRNGKEHYAKTDNSLLSHGHDCGKCLKIETEKNKEINELKQQVKNLEKEKKECLDKEKQRLEKDTERMDKEKEKLYDRQASQDKREKVLDEEKIEWRKYKKQEEEDLDARVRQKTSELNCREEELDQREREIKSAEARLRATQSTQDIALK